MSAPRPAPTPDDVRRALTVVLPAVARVEVPFTRALYAPVALLHLGLGARIAGDLLSLAGPRSVGALVSALALALFAATIVGSRLRGR